MGLAKRVIPVLLHRGSTLVKSKRFNAWRSVGHALQSAKIYASRGTDELIILNIGATSAGTGPDIEMVKNLTADSFTPITIGGGITSADQVRELLRAGADKISIKTAFIREPWIIKELSETFGSQAICVAIDVDWRRMEAISRAKKAAELGAGEILLTAIDKEGMMEGYDLDIIERISNEVGCPVIAHGGCGKPQDMLYALKAGASAVAASSLFLFTEETPRSCALYLQEQGVEVRIP